MTPRWASPKSFAATISSNPRRDNFCSTGRSACRRRGLSTCRSSIGPDGRRLAKRHGDTRLASLRTAGVRAESLVGLLAWSCGWIERPTPISARDLLPLFQLATIPRTPFILTPELLRQIGYTP